MTNKMKTVLSICCSLSRKKKFSEIKKINTTNNLWSIELTVLLHYKPEVTVFNPQISPKVDFIRHEFQVLPSINFCEKLTIGRM